jgi:hypothetical protein
MNPQAAQVTATSAVLVATAVQVLGPIIGPYVVIVIGAVGGGMLSLTTAETLTRRTGFKIMARAVLAGAGLSSAVAWALANMMPASWGATPEVLLFAVSFSVGFSADKLGVIRDKVLSKLNPLEPKQ